MLMGCLPCYTTSASCWSDISSTESSPLCMLGQWFGEYEGHKRRECPECCIGGVQPWLDHARTSTCRCPGVQVSRCPSIKLVYICLLARSLLIPSSEVSIYAEFRISPCPDAEEAGLSTHSSPSFRRISLHLGESSKTNRLNVVPPSTSSYSFNLCAAGTYLAPATGKAFRVSSST